MNLVINRTNAMDGIKQALAGEDFEGAARHVKGYYDLADSTEPESGPAQTPQAEEQAKVQLFCNTQALLCGDVRQKQDSADSCSHPSG